MLKYAVKHNGAEWTKIKVVNAGTPEAMEAAFHGGKGDYVHLQAPVLPARSSPPWERPMPPVAFSSLCCSRGFQKTEAYRVFLNAYGRAREWVRTAPAAEVAEAEASFFPLVAPEPLTAAVSLYQELGCWEGGLEIPRDLYEQALNVFQATGEIAWRHRYDEVVG